jgi:hypothetical protein
VSLPGVGAFGSGTRLPGSISAESFFAKPLSSSPGTGCRMCAGSARCASRTPTQPRGFEREASSGTSSFRRRTVRDVEQNQRVSPPLGGSSTLKPR